MYQGVFIGKNAKHRERRALILCESHYKKEGDVSSTESIVQTYLNNPSAIRIFDPIMKAFGVDPGLSGNRERFWNSVCFGNYLPVLCGVKNGVAKAYLQDKEKRQECNNDLFRFINKNEIDVVYCFSRLTYSKLPGLARRSREMEKRVECGLCGGKRDFIDTCTYEAGVDHPSASVKLKKPLTVFCMRHPACACGFDPKNYIRVLSTEKIKLLE